MLFALEQVMKVLYRAGVQVWLYSFLTSTLDGMGGQRHAPATLPPGKRRGVHCAGGLVSPTDCLVLG